MKVLDFYSTYFMKSFLNVDQINIYSDHEVAFLGYSNIGKSTLINVLSNQKKLSRVSKFPGSTQLINFFCINEKLRILDFPGYGYSRYIKSRKFNWLQEIKKYLFLRTCLIGVVLLVDINFFFKKNDLEIIYLLNKNKINFVILLNKCDQINLFLRNKKYFLAKKKLSFLNVSPIIQLFSSFKKIGILELKEILNRWYYDSFKIKI